jgi:integrase
VTAAKCYRLLRTILGTAVEDELVVKNPCVIKGAGVERTAERPIATVAQVHALAEAVPERFRAMVLLATYTGLRLGELLALRRRSIDLLHGTVTVAEQLVERGDGSLSFGPPKTEAGRRTVSIPPALLPGIEEHLSTWTGSGPDELVFTGVQGGPVRRTHWDAAWRKARAHVDGAERLHFHDLRHTGNTLAAATGASTRELMARMGHASPRAALIYQHATEDRDAAIAKALSDLITSVRPPSPNVVPLVPKSSSGS